MNKKGNPKMNAIVNVNVEMLKKDLEKTLSSRAKISEIVCGRSSTYLSSCYQRGAIGVKEFNRICEFYNLNADNYIVKEEPKPKTDETTTEKTKKEDDTLIVAIQILYDEQKKTNDLLNQLLVEIKGVNAKNGRIEGRLMAIENHVSKIDLNVIKGNDILDEVDKNTRETKSSIATINGRAKDIYDAVKVSSVSNIKAVK